MKKLNRFNFSLLFFTSLSAALYAGTGHAEQNDTPLRFESPECKKQNSYKTNYEKAQPAFYALMVNLCDWKTPLLPLEVGRYKSLWSKIAAGDNAEVYDILEYEALLKAKDTYDTLSEKKEQYSLPILPFSPNEMLSEMANSGKMSLMKEKQLRFYLKIFDCDLADADMDSVSGISFSQVFEINEEGNAMGIKNADAILERVVELEKKFWAKKKDTLTQKCTQEFSQSPLQLFAQAISPRLSEERSINPRSRSAVELATHMKKLKGEFSQIKDPVLSNKMTQSLTAAISEIEKSYPKI